MGDPRRKRRPAGSALGRVSASARGGRPPGPPGMESPRSPGRSPRGGALAPAHRRPPGGRSAPGRSEQRRCGRRRAPFPAALPAARARAQPRAAAPARVPAEALEPLASASARARPHLPGPASPLGPRRARPVRGEPRGSGAPPRGPGCSAGLPAGGGARPGGPSPAALSGPRSPAQRTTSRGVKIVTPQAC